MKSLFVSIVGPGLTGKTSVATKLAHELRTIHQKSVTVCKAYGPEEKERFEDWLAGCKDPMSRILVFAGLFREQRHAIEVALQKGHIVIAERWVEDAMVAMSQGDIANRPALRNTLLKEVFGSLIPDVTFLLSVCSDTARSRLAKRHVGDVTHTDSKEIHFHDAISERYKSVAQRTGANIICSEGTVDETVRLILDSLAQR